MSFCSRPVIVAFESRRGSASSAHEFGIRPSDGLLPRWASVCDYPGKPSLRRRSRRDFRMRSVHRRMTFVICKPSAVCVCRHWVSARSEFAASRNREMEDIELFRWPHLVGLICMDSLASHAPLSPACCTPQGRHHLEPFLPLAAPQAADALEPRSCESQPNDDGKRHWGALRALLAGAASASLAPYRNYDSTECD